MDLALFFANVGPVCLTQNVELRNRGLSADTNVVHRRIAVRRSLPEVELKLWHGFEHSLNICASRLALNRGALTSYRPVRRAG
jgi:hypothetical protein